MEPIAYALLRDGTEIHAGAATVTLSGAAIPMEVRAWDGDRVEVQTPAPATLCVTPHYAGVFAVRFWVTTNDLVPVVVPPRLDPRVDHARSWAPDRGRQGGGP